MWRFSALNFLLCTIFTLYESWSNVTHVTDNTYSCTLRGACIPYNVSRWLSEVFNLSKFSSFVTFNYSVRKLHSLFFLFSDFVIFVLFLCLYSSLSPLSFIFRLAHLVSVYNRLIIFLLPLSAVTVFVSLSLVSAIILTFPLSSLCSSSNFYLYSPWSGKL